MTPKRQQNPILVLATLGVYLGLVLAGATPQILAQAATTRQFDVKDEIEVKDDLDKNPKNNGDISQIGRLVKFAHDYSDIRLDEIESDVEFSRRMAERCPEGCRLSLLTYFPTLRFDLEEAFGTQDHIFTNFWSGNVQVESIEVGYKTSFSELSLLDYAFYQLSRTKSEKDNWALRTIAKHTVVSLNAKNRHLVITTRLARSDLDALRATFAK